MSLRPEEDVARPTLDMRAQDVPLEFSCERDWDQMDRVAGGARRWCHHCSKEVHDLSQMDARQAAAFLAATEGQDLCIAYAIENADEQMLFRKADPQREPDPQPLISPGSLVRSRRVLLQVAGASAAALLGACTPHDPNPFEVVEDRETNDAIPTAEVAVEPVDHLSPDAHVEVEVEVEVEVDADAKRRVQPCIDPPAKNIAPRIKKGMRKRQPHPP